MNALKAKIDRGLEIRGQLDRLKEELKEIESLIKAEAEAHPESHVPLLDAEREGRQYLATGSDLVVPVVFTADAIMQSFLHGSPSHLKVKEAAHGHFPTFYKEVHAFKATVEDGKLFRRKAREVLGPESAVVFVQACLARDKTGLPKSAVKIEWERAAAQAKLEEVATS